MQAKRHPAAFLCRDINPFFVLISSGGLHPLFNIGLGVAVAFVLRSEACGEGPVLG